MHTGSTRSRAKWRPTALLTMLVLAGCAERGAAGDPSVEAPDGAKSVILFTLDTTRRDRLGCYGYAGLTTPHLDRLAAASTVFDNAISTAAVTPVSHASILTGRWPFSHGLRVLHGLEQNRLDEDEVTLAEVLRDRGYATAAFISAFPAGSRFGLQQGFEIFEESFLSDAARRIVDEAGVVNTGRNQRIAGDTNALVLRWLEAAPRPFFLWVHYFDPHDPDVLPPDDYLSRFSPPTGSLRDRMRAIYDVEIRYMDEQLGHVLAALDRRADRADTVVAVVADHGEGLGDHDWWTHGVLYQEQIHVPLILRAPGVSAGARVDELVSTVDLMPTLLELAGVEPPAAAAFDGRSLVGLMGGERTGSPPPLAYADSVNMLTYRPVREIEDDKDDMLFALTDGRWKYIHHLLRPEESELYDLLTDPGELSNLHRSQGELAQRLLDELRALDFRPELAPDRDRMSPEDAERLRSLGYAD